MNCANLSSISGYRAFRPPYFFFISLVWNHLKMFLGWMFNYRALARTILDKPKFDVAFSYRIFWISFRLN